MECLSDLIRNAQVDNVTLHLPFQPSISKACLKINGHHITISKEDHTDVKVIGYCKQIFSAAVNEIPSVQNLFAISSDFAQKC